MSKYIVDSMIENKEKTWDNNKRERTEISEKIAVFMREYEDLCRKHNISLGHEDGHGAFEFHEYDREYIEWVAYGHKWE